jgi:L-threonylcarbamoyladenylate synthase
VAIPSVITETVTTDSRKRRATAVARAVEALVRGDVVALPTETVYGLAADATNAESVAKIFEAKERPFFDPLIVHVADLEGAHSVAEIPEEYEPLLERFWPGPLTVVVPRRACVPDLVTAGLPTVAIRMPAHPIFREVLAAFGKPLAAPSANRFGRISPTTADHVREELGGRIPLIVAAEPAQHGLESTIVQIADGKLRVLRNGPVTPEQLAEFGEVVEVGEPGSPGTPSVPGQLKSHYAPATPLRIGAPEATPGKRCGVLRFRGGPLPAGFAVVETLSENGDPREAAAGLFAAMRRLDAAGLDEIVAEPVGEEGLGHAIMDRLRKAAAHE